MTLFFRFMNFNDNVRSYFTVEMQNENSITESPFLYLYLIFWANCFFIIIQTPYNLLYEIFINLNKLSNRTIELSNRTIELPNLTIIFPNRPVELSNRRLSFPIVQLYFPIVRLNFPIVRLNFPNNDYIFPPHDYIFQSSDWTFQSSDYYFHISETGRKIYTYLIMAIERFFFTKFE